jgi:hypothetical protein
MEKETPRLLGLLLGCRLSRSASVLSWNPFSLCLATLLCRRLLSNYLGSKQKLSWAVTRSSEFIDKARLLEGDQSSKRRGDSLRARRPSF